MLSPEEKELVLKVANLIEEGSAGMDQILGRYFKEDKSGCCAMGAMLNALNCSVQESVKPTFNLLKLLDVYSWPSIPYPTGLHIMQPYLHDGKGNAPLPDVIIYLNDQLGWSFSRIIDYLRDCTLDTPVTIAVVG